MPGTSSGPSAATITVAQTLDLLDGPHAPVADAVARGGFVFWLGSGISRGRVDGLDGVVLRVLAFLQDKAASEGADSRHRQALGEAIELSRLPADRIPTVDVTRPVASWSAADQRTLVGALVERYSDLLDITVDGEPADYLLWDGVDVRATYAGGARPACEHWAIAILVLEGVLNEAASANWDGLIEAALTELGAPLSATDVVVLPDELRNTSGILRLIKFHGCAVKAAQDPARYRDALVGRASQISGWSEAIETAAIRGELVSLATTRPTLMIGLSAQDENIQAVFSAAKARMAWPWPCDPPANVFGSDRLGVDHLKLLKIVYKDDYSANATAIKASALIRAYGAQLLTALVLQVALAKLQAFLRCCDAPHLSRADLDALGTDLRDLRDRAAAHADNDRLRFIRALCREQSRALTLFRRGDKPAGGNVRFEPLGDQAVNRIAAAAGLPTSGMPELAAGLALIGRTATARGFAVDLLPTADGLRGALRVAGAASETAVFFAANPQAGVRLEAAGIVPSTAANVLVLHSSGPAPRMPRTPRTRFGRTGLRRPRHVDMSKLLREATALSELEGAFRMAAGL